MILRSLLLRRGRRALPRSGPSPIRSWRRGYASEIEQTYTSPHEAQAQIAGGVGGSTSQAALSTHPAPAAPSPAALDRVKADWDFFQHQKAVTGAIGSTLAPHYKPHELLSNPPAPAEITLELLLASQAHIGHSTSLWHPANAQYIFGVRGEQDPIHIISLDATAAHLRRACKVVSGVAERGGLILFVGSRDGQAQCVVGAAKRAGGCHLFSKWIPGTITNGQQILGRCRKRVVNHMDAEAAGFEDQLTHKAAVKPDLVVCLNMPENYVLLHECALNSIPTIGVLDTDCNPTWVTYPIPANDDSMRCVQVIAGVLGKAGEAGQAIRKRRAQRGQLPARQDHGLEPPTEKKEEEGGKKAEAGEPGQMRLPPVEIRREPSSADERIPAFGDEDVANLDAVERAVEERDARGVDRSLTGGVEEQDDRVSVPYERDAPIPGGADSGARRPS
ncbi:hypothetical protein LTR53_002199 [Teratosphaeriaceae sp. CCFEE 6253]|nr:hypothetical protein LTR53_002199 [Teratosphaeriaceae sp. CCFEE 6253]